MSEATQAPAVETPAEPSFAEFVRTENAKEQADKRGEAPEPAAPVEAAPETVESPVETAPAEPEAADEDTQPRADDGKFAKKDKVQARIDKAVRAQREAERKAAEYEARLAQLESSSRTPEASHSPARIEPPVQDGDPTPTLEQFLNEADPYQAHAKAVGEWAVRQAVRQMQAQTAEQSERQALGERMHAIQEAGRATYPDYDAVVASDFAQTFVFPPHILEAIRASDHGHDLIHYLGTHEQDARAVAALPPIEAVLSLGRLASQFSAAPSGSAPAVKPRSQAKPLIKPVSAAPSASAQSPPDYDAMPFSTFVKTENAAEARNRKAMRGA